MSAAYKSNYHTNGSVQESLVIISASISQYNNNMYNCGLIVYAAEAEVSAFTSTCGLVIRHELKGEKLYYYTCRSNPVHFLNSPHLINFYSEVLICTLGIPNVDGFFVLHR